MRGVRKILSVSPKMSAKEAEGKGSKGEQKGSIASAQVTNASLPGCHEYFSLSIAEGCLLLSAGRSKF
jgi:hypothetical protein